MDNITPLTILSLVVIFIFFFALAYFFASGRNKFYREYLVRNPRYANVKMTVGGKPLKGEAL